MTSRTTTEHASTPDASPALVIMEAKAAELLSLSMRTLQRLRMDGDGPPHIQLGPRRIGYRKSDLETWLAGRVVASTSEATTRRAA